MLIFDTGARINLWWGRKIQFVVSLSEIRRHIAGGKRGEQGGDDEAESVLRWVLGQAKWKMKGRWPMTGRARNDKPADKVT